MWVLVELRKHLQNLGYRDWKHATGKGGVLQRHAKCTTHLHAVSSWHTYTINKESGTSIANSLDSLRNQQICENRHYLASVIEVVLLCGRLEIALRGHNESDLSSNRGNFREIFDVVANHDSIIKKRINCGPRNATYFSPEIQNEFLKIMGNVVRKSVVEGVKKAGYFSLLQMNQKM